MVERKKCPLTLLHVYFSFKYDTSLLTLSTISFALYVNVALLFNAALSRNFFVFFIIVIVGFACSIASALQVANIVPSTALTYYKNVIMTPWINFCCCLFRIGAALATGAQ